jgi:hypothetical protein
MEKSCGSTMRHVRAERVKENSSRHHSPTIHLQPRYAAFPQVPKSAAFVTYQIFYRRHTPLPETHRRRPEWATIHSPAKRGRCDSVTWLSVTSRLPPPSPRSHGLQHFLAACFQRCKLFRTHVFLNVVDVGLDAASIGSDLSRALGQHLPEHGGHS